jgi:hypothetical protein
MVDDAGHVALTNDAPAHAMSAVSKVKSKMSHKAFGANKIDEIELEIALWDKPTILKLAGPRRRAVPGPVRAEGRRRPAIDAAG